MSITRAAHRGAILLLTAFAFWLPSAATAATVHCGHGYINGVPFAHVSLTITTRAMNDIYRPAAFRSRGRADCELAHWVAAEAASSARNRTRLDLVGEHYQVGIYRCRFSTPQAFHVDALHEYDGEAGRCEHVGRDSNTVRFVVMALEVRQQIAQEPAPEELPPKEPPPGVAQCGQLLYTFCE